MQQRLLSLAVGLCLAWPAGAAGDEGSPAWIPTITVGGAAGTRFYAESWLQWPIFQNADHLIFADMRGSLFEGGAYEGNLGFVWRGDVWGGGPILGAYVYGDRRRSETENLYAQITLGADLLAQDWEGRINSYVPIGDRTHFLPGSQRASVQGRGLVMEMQEERALYGLDIEAGLRLPVFDATGPHGLWMHGGGFIFDDRAADAWYGGTARLEYRLSDIGLPNLPHARLTLGAEGRVDQDGEVQALASLRVSIPLGPGGARPQGIKARMMDPVRRDVDIIARTHTFTEEARLATGGAPASQVTVIDASMTAAARQTAVTAAGPNAVIFADGSKGVLDNGATPLTLGLRQHLIGAGAQMVGARTGVIAPLGGTQPHFQANVGRSVIIANQAASVQGISATVRGPTSPTPIVLIGGVDAAGANNIAVLNSRLQAEGTGATGFLARNSANILAQGNKITVSGVGGSGIYVGDSSDIVFRENIIQASGTTPTTVTNRMGIAVIRGNRLLVENNFVVNTGEGHAIMTHTSNNITIRNNRAFSYGAHDDAIRIDNFDSGVHRTQNVLIENNYAESHGLHSRTILVYQADNVTVRNNEAYNWGNEGSRAIAIRVVNNFRVLNNLVAAYHPFENAGIRIEVSNGEVSYNRILQAGTFQTTEKAAWGGAIQLRYDAGGPWTVTGVGNVWTGNGSANACATYGAVGGGIELFIERYTTPAGSQMRNVLIPGEIPTYTPIVGNRVICKSP